MDARWGGGRLGRTLGFLELVVRAESGTGRCCWARWGRGCGVCWREPPSRVGTATGFAVGVGVGIAAGRVGGLESSEECKFELAEEWGNSLVESLPWRERRARSKKRLPNDMEEMREGREGGEYYGNLSRQ